MNRLRFKRSAAVASLVTIAMSLAVATLCWPGPAQAGRARQQAASADLEQSGRHARLKSRLASTRPDEFRAALANLARLDEQGALDVWRVALNNPDPGLKKLAWRSYQKVQLRLARKAEIPRIARILAPADKVRQAARAYGMELSVWSESGNETVAAAPEYLIREMRREGFGVNVIYDSIYAWQKAGARGEAQALSITPEYLSERAAQSQVRVAVIDLAGKSSPAPGYSDWLGDRENIIFRNDSFIAYLDIFTGQDVADSIASRIENNYTRRGYRLAGFYTLDEFAEKVSRFFPGESFDPGRTPPAAGRSQVRTALSDGRFHNYEETLAEFNQLAQSHPEIAKIVELGRSYENRQIFALKISRDPQVDDSSKADVLITGCHHAREWISVEPPVYLANQLIRSYATDDSVKHLVDNLQIWIVPILNPDGLTYSQGSPNNQLDTARLWRKNRRPVDADGCKSSVGVDLNRNYDFQWRLRGDEPCPTYSDDAGASDNAESEIYRGPRPESEPEVKAIKSLMDDPNRNFRAHLDYHNYSQLILYPWGYLPFTAPDAATLDALARRMSDEMFSVGLKRYQPQQAVDLYSTTGSAIDYDYGANGVAAAFIIEMRPNCCGFNISEGEIGVTNQENWAGARMIMNWAGGPPIIESVKAYQAAPDGNFTKLVYSARWTRPGDSPGSNRRIEVDTRFPGVESGRLQLRLQFSKPMNSLSAPRATIGLDGKFDELSLAAADGVGGWQKTAYANDTWIGETVIPPADDRTDPWRLAVSATDAIALKLDGAPETVASYATGTGRWSNYEDGDGTGSTGGTDIRHVLSPTLRGDRFDIFVGAPNGGERVSSGEPFTVAWTIPKESGFVPVQQEIWLSTDGGATYSPLTQQIQGNIDRINIVLPTTPTARARVRILAREGSVGNTIAGDSKADFTIGANVGAGVDMVFVSSEQVNLNWSDSSFGDPVSGASQLAINISITNRSDRALANPFLRVAELSRGNVLLTRDSRSNPASGARQLFDVGSDNLLSPGETAQVRLLVGLVGKKKFNFSVELYGVTIDGQSNPASPVAIWRGKPRAR